MDITKCGYFCTPPNVAAFGVATLGYYQMWLLLYSTKCGSIWSTLGYYQMWLLLYSTKCGSIWSTLGYYQMWLLLYSTKCGNIWGTHGYYQMWLYFCTPPNEATFGVITKCGYFCTPPNVAIFGVPMDITKCGYFCTPPNEATFGVPMDRPYQFNFLLHGSAGLFFVNWKNKRKMGGVLTCGRGLTWLTIWGRFHHAHFR